MASEEKNRRMDLCREIGNRKVKSDSASSLSPAPPYLTAHTCFNCRKSFKLRDEKSHICPECGDLICINGKIVQNTQETMLDEDYSA